LLEDVTAADEIHSVTFAVDNTKVIIGRGDKRVSLQQLPFRRLLSGHDGAISSLAYLPDGGGLISGGADKSARHWNLETGKMIRSLAHTDAVTGVGVTADGVKIISTSADKTVRVWTLASGAAAATITLESPVRQFSLSADSTRAITAGDDHIIRVWDIATARELERFTGHEATVSSLALSADNRTVISAAADKTVRAWTIGVDRLFVADLKSVHTMVLTPEGKHIVTAGEDKLVKLWDLEGKMVRQFSGAAAPLRSVAVRGDGLQIAAGGDPVLTQVNVYVWNAANGQPVRTQKMPAPVSSLTYSGDGKLAVATADKHLRAYASDDARLLQDWTVAATLNDLAFTPDHTTVAAAAADNQAYILDYSLRRLLTGHVGPVTGVAFTPTGGRLLSCGADKSVRLWNAADGKPLSQFVGSTAAVHSLALSRDGTKLTAAGEDKMVRVWDVPGDQADPPQQVQPSATFTHPAIVRSTSITDNGSTVAAGGDDNLIRLWDVATGKERERIAGPAGAVLAVSLSADGRDLVSGSADNHARQMFPSVSAVVAAQQGEIHDVVFAADGDAVFTAGADKFVQRSSLRSPAVGQNEAKTSLQFTGATAAVRTVAVSRDGKYVSAGGDDMHVRVWNASDGKSLATIKTPAMVTSVVTSGDGRTIVAAGADKIIRNYALLQIDGVWQLKLTHELQGHTDAVTRMSLAGDDRTLLSVAADSTAKRWLVASALPQRQLSGHKGPIYDLAFHKDGRLLASASGDRTARVWDLADGEVRFSCKGHERQVTGVSFHPSGNQLASCSLDASVRLWSSEIAPDPLPADAEPDKQADPPPPAEEKKQPGDPLNVLAGDIKDGLNSLAYAPNGNYLVAAGLAKVWRQWPTGGETPFELLRSGQLHNYQIYRIVPNPASTRFATIDFSGKLFIWDAANGNPLFHQQLPASSGYSIAYAPNGQELVAATSDLRVARVLIPIPAR
ncbi:MAG: WD40 repeat domain-containing protein, partial [Pirellulales bacterium]